VRYLFLFVRIIVYTLLAVYWTLSSCEYAGVLFSVRKIYISALLRHACSLFARVLRSFFLFMRELSVPLTDEWTERYNLQN
jgi:hypothetical protein